MKLHPCVSPRVKFVEVTAICYAFGSCGRGAGVQSGARRAGDPAGGDETSAGPAGNPSAACAAVAHGT